MPKALGRLRTSCANCSTTVFCKSVMWLGADCGVVGVQRSAPFPLTVILTVTDTVRVTVPLGLARRAVNNFLTTEVHRSSHP